MLKLFEFVLGTIIVVGLIGCFFVTTVSIVALHLDLGIQDALAFAAFCFYFFIGVLLFVDFEEK